VEMDIVKKVYALAKEMVVIFMGLVFKDSVFIGVKIFIYWVIKNFEIIFHPKFLSLISG
jgi:hypothetical protein